MIHHIYYFDPRSYRWIQMFYSHSIEHIVLNKGYTTASTHHENSYTLKVKTN